MCKQHPSKDNFNYIINFLCLYRFFSQEIHTSGRIPKSSLAKPESIPFLIIWLCFRYLVIYHWQDRWSSCFPLASHKIHLSYVCPPPFPSDISSDLEGRREQDRRKKDHLALVPCSMSKARGRAKLCSNDGDFSCLSVWSLANLHTFNVLLSPNPRFKVSFCTYQNLL